MRLKIAFTPDIKCKISCTLHELSDECPRFVESQQLIKSVAMKDKKMMNKQFYLLICLAWSCLVSAQSNLIYIQPSYWEIYDFSTSFSDDQWRARDAIVTNAPKNGNKVIDTLRITAITGGFNEVSILSYHNIEEINKYDKRIWDKSSGIINWDHRTWEYNSDGTVVQNIEFEIDPDTSLMHFRFYDIDSDGLIGHLFYGFDMATLDSTNPEYGFVDYHYTGMRLDSNTFTRLNGSYVGRFYYYYSANRFDSIIYDYGKGYYTQGNYFTYDLNGKVLKDSLSTNWPSNPSWNNQWVKNWIYSSNGALDSAYALDYDYGGSSPVVNIEMKVFYNSSMNYDSLFIKQGGARYGYKFSYQKSAFDLSDIEVNNKFRPYPNPVKAGSKLVLEKNTTRILLYSLEGSLIKEIHNVENNRISVPDRLTPGLYTLQWFVEGQINPRTQKLVIRN